MIKVKSIKEAWTKADELFPTDYEKDDVASANAGYPIYMSTLDGCNSWISDLNTSLELNIQEGKKIKTVRIVIEEEPEIIEEKVIDADSVRMCCVKHYYRQRVCAVCGSTYWPTHSQQKFCSEECKKINHNKKTLEFYHKKQKEKTLCKDLLQTEEQVSDTNSSEITIIPA